MVISKIRDFYDYLKHRRLNNIEELKKAFRKCGYYVDENNIVIYKNIVKGNTKVTVKINLEQVIRNFKDIVKNRKENGWQNIFKELLEGGE